VVVLRNIVLINLFFFNLYKYITFNKEKQKIYGHPKTAMLMVAPKLSVFNAFLITNKPPYIL